MHFGIQTNNFHIVFLQDKHRIFLEHGIWGSLKLLKSPIICAVIRKISTGETISVDADTVWKHIRMQEHENAIELFLCAPNNIEDIIFHVEARYTQDSIIWSVEVLNDSKDFSVMEVAYPTPKITTPSYNLFVPVTCGRVIQDAGKTGYHGTGAYPHHQFCMQYFAVYSSNNGMYIGLEDSTASVKNFEITSENDAVDFRLSFLGINATHPGNSFAASGTARRLSLVCRILESNEKI